ncbi:hypothetical protein BDE02_01G360600 [Populus trichocarpa]|nr:hypothetical protein BDE02_01G360600 [Populus trichocarpa]
MMDSGTINTDLGVCKKRRKREDKKNPRGGQTQKTLEEAITRKNQKKKQEQREERLKRGGGEHSPVGACTVIFAFGFTRLLFWNPRQRERLIEGD